MDSEELYSELMKYFPKNLDLMRHLNIHACWEYIITEKSTYEEKAKLHFFLYKKDNSTLEITKKNPNFKLDLILYFTEKAILSLIEDNPNATEYFARYSEVMSNPKSGIEVDNKVNKPRLKLWQIGYKKWRSDFKF